MAGASVVPTFFTINLTFKHYYPPTHTHQENCQKGCEVVARS